MSIAYTSPTILFTLSGNSCMYSLAVVSAFACRRCASVAGETPRNSNANTPRPSRN
jgi:hypothetical protein